MLYKDFSWNHLCTAWHGFFFGLDDHIHKAVFYMGGYSWNLDN